METRYYQHKDRKWDTTYHSGSDSSHAVKINHGWVEVTEAQYTKIRQRNIKENQRNTTST